MAETTAFSIWGERIAPLFDEARRLHLVKTEHGRVVGEGRAALADDPESLRGLRLAELGVRLLVCGAISRPLLAVVEGYGIRVLPFIAGGLRDVMDAWRRGGSAVAAFAMPGCARWGRFRHGRTIGWEAAMIFARRGGGGGGGRGGPFAAGPGGFCVCPACGHRARHEAGTPCMRRRCPKCGSVMTRET